VELHTLKNRISELESFKKNAKKNDTE